MRRFAPTRRSRWRRARPSGLIPPLPPPRQQPTGDGSPPRPRAEAAPGVRQAPAVAAPGGEPPVPPDTAGGPDGDAWSRPGPSAWPRPSVAGPAADGGNPVPDPRPARAPQRVRVLHSESELDDARARAAAQLERIEAAMGPVVQRQQRSSGGGA